MAACAASPSSQADTEGQAAALASTDPTATFTATGSKFFITSPDPVSDAAEKAAAESNMRDEADGTCRASGDSSAAQVSPTTFEDSCTYHGFGYRCTTTATATFRCSDTSAATSGKSAAR